MYLEKEIASLLAYFGNIASCIDEMGFQIRRPIS
jgi:hypothetical protein